jgi:murein DD-endopeptidase MepM/ murein hydrolase activator NlpD
MLDKIKSFVTKKLFTKYRLVIMNDSNFEEKLSFRLSRMNVFIITISVSFLLIVSIVVIIAFTPIREYIPGYSNVEDRHQLYRLSKESDSLKTMISVTSQYLDSLMIVLSGTGSFQRIDFSEISRFIDVPEFKTEIKYTSDLGTSVKNTLEPFLFYKPVEGVITQEFLPALYHFGIDVVTPIESPVLAIRDGSVILARWSYQFGNMIIIQHPNNFISVYKHNSVLLKKEGDKVKGGEPIAISGNTGEISTGPHLHIEMWMNGTPVNPAIFLNY